jgi:hypothetical protein
MNEIGWFISHNQGGARWHFCDGDGQKMVIKCSNLKMNKEKNKMGLKAKV